MKHYLIKLSTPCVLLVAVAGCSRTPSRLVLPDINSNAGNEAIEKFDTNKDGALDVKELSQAPALKAALGRMDKDGDSRLTAAEIDGRIDAWRESRAALTAVLATIRLDGRPLVGAEVSFVPDPILGDKIETAKGITDEKGMTRIRISEKPEGRGVRPGFYSIHISKAKDGKEQLPKRYVDGTELGIEVVYDVYEARNPILNLTSK